MEIDTRERDYFVSLIRDKRTALLAGPFKTHADALAQVVAARAAAGQVDPWSDFDAIGTCSLPLGSGHVGKLNKQIGATHMTHTYPEATLAPALPACAPIYFILCDAADPTWMERTDPSWSRTIRDIREGQVEDVVQVLECDPVAGTCRDVTQKAREAVFVSLNGEDPGWTGLRDFLAG